MRITKKTTEGEIHATLLNSALDFRGKVRLIVAVDDGTIKIWDVAGVSHAGMVGQANVSEQKESKPKKSWEK